MVAPRNAAAPGRRACRLRNQAPFCDDSASTRGVRVTAEQREGDLDEARAWAFAGRVPGGRRFGGRGRRRERGESCGDTDAGGRSRSRRGELRGEHRVYRVILQ